MKRKKLLLMEMLKNSEKMRKVFLLLAAVAVCFCMAGEAMAQIVDSGETGDCTWTLTGTSDNYTLTISGTGAMGSNVPWSSYRTGIKTVDIQQGVTSIGNYAFSGYTALTSVTISNSVESIGYSAFQGCSGLTSVTIPHSVTSIGNYAFQGCSSLIAINIDANNPNYSSIDGVLFNKSQSELIQYPAGKAGNYTIPNSVTSIGYLAFYNCTGLISITIGSSITTSLRWQNEGPILGCSSLTAINVDANNPIFSSIDGVLYNKAQTVLLGCPEGKTSVVIPNTVDSIDGGAFYYCVGLTSVTIPNSVTSIGSNVFYGCSGLTSVTIGNSLAAIPASTFSECSSLSSIAIPNTVTSIGNYAFYKCTELKKIVMEDGNTPLDFYYTAYTASSPTTDVFKEAPLDTVYLGRNIVYKNSYTAKNIYADLSPFDKSTVKCLIVGNSVTAIENKAFYGCSGLTSVTIPSSVISIRTYAFYGCSSLTSVTIPDLVTFIGTYAFAGCSSLTSVTIPDLVTSIGTYVFAGCNDLTSLTIGNSVASIGTHAFSGCSSLTSVTIPDLVKSIGNSAFYNCNNLTSLTIGNSVTSIGNDAFSGCTGLKKLVIADGNTALPFNYFNSSSPYTNNIFAECPLDTVYLGRNITYDNTYDNNTSRDLSPFYNKTTIQHLIVGNQVTAIGNNAFYNSPIVEAIMPISPPSGTINSSLKKLTITATCTSLSSGGLSSATNLQELTVPFIGTSPTSPRTLSTLFNGSVPVSLKKLSLVRSSSNIQIAENALAGLTQLTELVLSSNVQGLGRNALDGCSGLEHIYSHCANPPGAYDNSTFEGIGKYSCIIHVPVGVDSKNRYATAAGWREFYVGNIWEEAAVKLVARPLPYYGGVIDGSLEYNYDANAALTAGGNSGYVFQCWMEGNAIVSTSATYNFTVTAPRTLYAVFTPRENENNVTVTPQPTEVSIAWDGETGASSYTLVIYTDAARTQVYTTLHFDADGTPQQAPQLRSVQSRMSHTVNGLQAGADYYYSITSYDAEDYALTIAVGDFTTLSSGSGIETVESGKIRIYPNPARESFRIEGLTVPTPITVTDISGRTVLQQTVEKDESISVGHWAKGIYLVRVNGKTVKVVKN